MRRNQLRFSKVTEEEVASICGSFGFEFQDMRKVRYGVYRGTLSASDTGLSRKVYIKLYRNEKRQSLRDLVKIGPGSGHPDCRLVEGKYLCLLMNVAKGQPLSRVLPLACLPGVWSLYRKRLESAYFQIGTHIGTLHTATKADPEPVLNETEICRALERTELLSGVLSPSEIERTRDCINQARDYYTPCSVTYRDRSPHNIYFDGTKVTQIDCACDRASVIKDHASLMLGVRLTVTRLLYVPSSVKSALIQAYCDGYSTTGIPAPIDGDAFRIHYLSDILAVLDHYNNPSKSPVARLSKYRDTPVLFRKVKQLIDRAGNGCQGSTDL